MEGVNDTMADHANNINEICLDFIAICRKK